MNDTAEPTPPREGPPDFYQHNAEWYAALVAPQLPAVRDALTRLLAGPLPAGAAVEVGPGVGATLDVLLDAGAQSIYAVEPSGAMRVGLMTRVALDPRLAASTTIMPGTVDAMVHHIPREWSAVVMLNALGHLDPEAEERLWDEIARRLVPDGRVVIGLQPPQTPVDIPWTDFGSTQVGQHTLWTRGSASATGPASVDWRMEWTLRDAQGEVLDTRAATSSWRTITVDALTQAAEGAGLEATGTVDSLSMYAFVKR